MLFLVQCILDAWESFVGEVVEEKVVRKIGRFWPNTPIRVILSPDLHPYYQDAFVQVSGIINKLCLKQVFDLSETADASVYESVEHQYKRPPVWSLYLFDGDVPKTTRFISQAEVYSGQICFPVKEATTAAVDAIVFAAILEVLGVENETMLQEVYGCRKS